jgi:hypothetical protein
MPERVSRGRDYNGSDEIYLAAWAIGRELAFVLRLVDLALCLVTLRSSRAEA